MSLEKILSIGGKPGLYRLVARTRTGFVAESLQDGRKVSMGMTGNVSVLSEIAIYTLDEELPLSKVFEKIREKEEGGKTPVTHKADKLELEEYFFEVLPNYDEDRVYAGDIRKVIQWYNLLCENGITDFESAEADAESTGEAEAAPKAKTAPKAEATSKNKAVPKDKAAPEDGAKA